MGERDPRVVRAWLLVALWVTVIFFFSADSFSADHTARWLRDILRFLFPEIRSRTMYEIHVALRRGAHVSVYGILALLAFRACFLTAGPGFARAAALAMALVVLPVASADELRQSTSKVRSGRWGDVMLDLGGAFGALAGLGVLLAVRRSRGGMA